MAEMKTLNGYEIVDAKAREELEFIKDTGLVVPTKVSAFENDAGYLTQHQDISGKADKAHTHTLSDVSDYVAPDLEPLATKEYVDEKVANIDIGDIVVELSNYYTKEETDTAIKEAVDALDIPEVDFTGYATEQYVNDAVAAIPTKVSQLQNDTGYVTSGYVDSETGRTKTWVENQSYASKTYVDSAVPTKVSELEQDVAYLTDGDVTTRMENMNNDINSKLETFYALKSEIPDVSAYVTMPQVEAKGYLTAVPSQYATKVDVDAKIAAIDYSKYVTDGELTTAVDNIYMEVGNELESTYATKKEVTDTVNDAITGVSVPSWHTVAYRDAVSNKVPNDIKFTDIYHVLVSFRWDGTDTETFPVTSSSTTGYPLAFNASDTYHAYSAYLDKRIKMKWSNYVLTVTTVEDNTDISADVACVHYWY